MPIPFLFLPLNKLFGFLPPPNTVDHFFFFCRFVSNAYQMRCQDAIDLVVFLPAHTAAGVFFFSLATRMMPKEAAQLTPRRLFTPTNCLSHCFFRFFLCAATLMMPSCRRTLPRGISGSCKRKTRTNERRERGLPRGRRRQR